MHRLGLQFHFEALALQIVGTVATNLAGRVRGGHLLDIADETSEDGIYQLTGDVCRWEGGIHLVLLVVAGRGGTELQRCSIFLAIQLQAFYLLGFLARAEYKHTSGQWVEGASMTNFHAAHAYLLGYARTHKGQSTERRHAIGFVDVYVFALCEVHLIYHC